MASSRHDRPKRSANASGESRDKRYRYKSYLDADTQEMARFDAMQEHVPDKIDEVMASFREDKLTVAPSRRKAPEEMEVENTPFFSTAKVTRPQKKRYPVWIWWVGLLVLGAGGWMWLSAKPEAPTASPSLVTAAEKSSPIASAVVSTPEEVAPAPEPKQEVVAVQPKVEPVPPASSAKSKESDEAKPLAASKKKPKKPAPVHRYSEDLSDMLQNR